MIASEALDSIQLFLRMPNATTGTSFRAFVDTSIMNRIIDLAPVFGEIIVHPNQGYVADVPPLTNVTTFPLSSAKEDTAKLSKATYTEPSRCNSEKHITSSLSDHGTSVLSHEVKLLW